MIVIDYRDKRPLYEQVTEKLAHLIICGALESNSRLPSVRSLAMDLSVNPNTIQRAYTQLEQEGFIYSVVGRGNYVTDSSEWRNGMLRALERDLKELLTKAAESGMPIDMVYSMVKQTYENIVDNADKTAEAGKEDASHD